MIRITCTNCKAELSIDDAFAGGVCRCQFCGTIQTVPKHLKNGAAAAGVAVKTPAGSQGTKGKSSAKIDTGLSSGLDALAEVLASSTLTGSGLSSSNPRRSQLTSSDREIVPPSARNNRTIPLLVGGGIVIILLLGVVIGLLMRGGGGDKPGDSPPHQEASSNNVTPAVTEPPRVEQVTPPTITPPVAPPKVEGPAFFGVKISEPSVIFILDRGTSTRDSFEFMKTACLNSLDTLKPQQKYQIIFWKIDKDLITIPKNLTSAADPLELRKSVVAMDDVNSYGVSDVRPALDKAFSEKPAAIVIATGKALDENFTKAVMDARKGANIKVHCISLVEPQSNKAMADVAHKTGGTFKFVSLAELRSVTR
jgi:hypothetical protein